MTATSCRVRRIVRDTVRDNKRLNVAVAIFVLQTFVVHVVRPEVPPIRKPRSLLVASLPAHTQIADTFEPGTGVVDVERIIGRLLCCKKSQQPASQCRGCWHPAVDTFPQTRSFRLRSKQPAHGPGECTAGRSGCRDTNLIGKCRFPSILKVRASSAMIAARGGL